MYARRIAIETIDDGLDRKLLTTLKKRFLQINQARLERMRTSLAFRQHIFVDLLPLLLHTNHPVLPGYLSHQTPAGVCGYTPSKEEIRKASSLARSFRFNRDYRNTQAIDALFVMGSVGTIAHSKASDLDIWVCYNTELDHDSIVQLERKCQKLSAWGSQLGLETHFFLMNAHSFRSERLRNFNKEASGSAQHLLLLDEFYRTGILLAGKMPLWWFVPTTCEQDYAHYTEILLSRRYLKAAEYLDFGPIGALPEREFIGAGIWQLYKAIEAPYKSVLKLMLLECYAHEYPEVAPLSLLFKQKIFDGELNIDDLDPYVLIYQQLENYLQQRGEHERLELVRRCFYYKVNKLLSKPITGIHKSWQRLYLETLVDEWGWGADVIKLLDSRSRWKAVQVISERKALVKELNASYRFLVDFARQLQIDVAIDANEFAVLGRKLYASFERKAGKIEWINPNISDDLSEEHLTVVEHYDEYLHDTKWAVYALPEQEYRAQLSSSNLDGPDNPAGMRPVKQTRQLMELLTWCYCNELLASATSCDVVASNSNVTNRLLQQLYTTLHRWLPLPLPTVPHEQFKQTSHLRAALFIINVGVDVYPQLEEQGVRRVSEHSDALGYSAYRENLVLSIDLVTRNNWNEIETTRFDGDALVRCLLHFFRINPPGIDKAFPEITVYCGTPGYGNTIRQRIEILFKDLQRCFFSGTRAPSTRYLFEVATHYYCLQFTNNQPKVYEARDYNELLILLSEKQSQFSALLVDQQALIGMPLRLIAGVSETNAIQVFYAAKGMAADVYVLDEKGSLFFAQLPFLDEATLLRPLHRFIRAVIDRQSVQDPNFCAGFGIYPVDFYRLSRSQLVRTTPATSGEVRADDYRTNYTHIERCRISSDLSKLSFVNVQAIAQAVAPNHLAFNIYCDQVEFSEMEYGPRLFHAVAEYILSQRRGRERYPCYITDLDLSQCQSLVAPSGSLQVCHYLEIKAPLEAKLNAALDSL